MEPSFGGGDFLFPIVQRLVASWLSSLERSVEAVEELSRALKGVELHRDTFEKTRQLLVEKLCREGIDDSLARYLCSRWLVQGDFLLEPQSADFDYVVGNPPYVRQELIPAPLLEEYRRRYTTLYDRADLYIPFIEKSLALLKPGGKLGFICADRWMKNRYGGPLRGLVSQEYSLNAYVDMVDTDAFHGSVAAYPAVTVIARELGGTTRIARRPRMDKSVLSSLAAEITGGALSSDSSIIELRGVANGSQPWLIDSCGGTGLVRRIEGEFPRLEEAGCRVGIGVATGADRVFIGDFQNLDVESDRKLPLVATRDIKSGEVRWCGQGVINPFAPDGRLVDLVAYPKLARYLEDRKAAIVGRHCAQKSPTNWYRTIDRIWPELLKQPKLLIPDIKGEAHVVYDSGQFYPHHNLYYVVSETWNLRALQAVLLSSIASHFVESYSTKMRGGYLRFQAQYLRRIRVPFWSDVSSDMRSALILAAENRDLEACNRLSRELFRVSASEALSIK